jgi:hypothetical protein
MLQLFEHATHVCKIRLLMNFSVSGLPKVALTRRLDLAFVYADLAIECLIQRLNRLQGWVFVQNQRYHGTDIKALEA